MEEFKDKYLGIEVRLEEILNDIQNLPTDYKLAEQYAEIDQEVLEIKRWYEHVKCEREIMENRIERINKDVKDLYNHVQDLRLREFSRVLHGGSYSQLPEFRRR